MSSGNNHPSLMNTLEYRKYVRVRRNFPVRLFIKDSNLFIEGITTNLSQGGAFIKSKNRHSCQAGAHVFLTLFLPPDFTGQKKTIGLQGDAVIKRIDQENKGIAVEFINALREFERIDLPDFQEKTE
jgi:Tfp pilus assembly protein PilZ